MGGCWFLIMISNAHHIQRSTWFIFAIILVCRSNQIKEKLDLAFDFVKAIFFEI